MATSGARGRLVIPDAFKEADEPGLRKAKSWAPASPTFGNGPSRPRRPAASPTANTPQLQVTEPDGAAPGLGNANEGEMKRAVSAVFGVNLRKTVPKTRSAMSPTTSQGVASPQAGSPPVARPPLSPASKQASAIHLDPSTCVAPSTRRQASLVGIPKVASETTGDVRVLSPVQSNLSRVSHTSSAVGRLQSTESTFESDEEKEAARGGTSPLTSNVRAVWERKVQGQAPPPPPIPPLAHAVSSSTSGMGSPPQIGTPSTGLTFSRRRSLEVSKKAAPSASPPGEGQSPSHQSPKVMHWERRVRGESVAVSEDAPVPTPPPDSLRAAPQTRGSPPAPDACNASMGRVDASWLAGLGRADSSEEHGLDTSAAHVNEKKRIFEAGDGSEDLSPLSVSFRAKRRGSSDGSRSPVSAAGRRGNRSYEQLSTSAPSLLAEMAEAAIEFEDVQTPLRVANRSLFVADCQQDRTDVWEYEKGAGKKRPTRRVLTLPAVAVALGTDCEKDVMDPLLELQAAKKAEDGASPVLMFAAGSGLKSDIATGRCDRMAFARFRKKITTMSSQASFVVLEPEQEMLSVWRSVKEFVPEATCTVYLGESVFGIASAGDTYVADFCTDSAIDSTESLKLHMGVKCQWPPQSGFVAMCGAAAAFLVAHCGLEYKKKYEKGECLAALRQFLNTAAETARHQLAAQFLDLAFGKFIADGSSLYLDSDASATAGATLERLRIGQRSAFDGAL